MLYKYTFINALHYYAHLIEHAYRDHTILVTLALNMHESSEANNTDTTRPAANQRETE